MWRKWSFNEWLAAGLIPLLIGVLVASKWLDYPDIVMGTLTSALTMIVIFFFRKSPPEKTP